MKYLYLAATAILVLLSSVASSQSILQQDSVVTLDANLLSLDSDYTYHVETRSNLNVVATVRDRQTASIVKETLIAKNKDFGWLRSKSIEGYYLVEINYSIYLWDIAADTVELIDSTEPALTSSLQLVTNYAMWQRADSKYVCYELASGKSYQFTSIEPAFLAANSGMTVPLVNAAGVLRNINTSQTFSYWNRSPKHVYALEEYIFFEGQRSDYFKLDYNLEIVDTISLDSYQRINGNKLHYTKAGTIDGKPYTQFVARSLSTNSIDTFTVQGRADYSLHLGNDIWLMSIVDSLTFVVDTREKRVRAMPNSQNVPRLAVGLFRLTDTNVYLQDQSNEEQMIIYDRLTGDIQVTSDWLTFFYAGAYIDADGYLLIHRDSSYTYVFEDHDSTRGIQMVEVDETSYFNYIGAVDDKTYYYGVNTVYENEASVSLPIQRLATERLRSKVEAGGNIYITQSLANSVRSPLTWLKSDRDTVNSYDDVRSYWAFGGDLYMIDYDHRLTYSDFDNLDTITWENEAVRAHSLNRINQQTYVIDASGTLLEISAPTSPDLVLQGLSDDVSVYACGITNSRERTILDFTTEEWVPYTYLSGWGDSTCMAIMDGSLRSFKHGYPSQTTTVIEGFTEAAFLRAYDSTLVYIQDEHLWKAQEGGNQIVARNRSLLDIEGYYSRNLSSPHLYLVDDLRTTLNVYDIKEDVVRSIGTFLDIGDSYQHEDQLFFAAHTAAHGQELWTSDGTAEGTYMLFDLTGDETSSSVSEISYNASTGHIYWSAVNSEGMGLYTYPFMITSSAIDVTADADLLLWPNPTTDIVYLPAGHHEQLTQIYDLSGSLVLTTTSTSTGINVSHLPAGWYSMRTLSQNGKIWTAPFVKM